MMKLLVIKDDKAGHYNQTEGILAALKTLESLEIEYVNVSIKSKILRKIAIYLINILGEKISKINMHIFLNFQNPKNTPEFVISTGGNTAQLNVYFKYLFKCKNLLNGKPRGIDEKHFNAVSTIIDLNLKNQIILDIAPSNMDDETLHKAKQNFLKSQNLSGDFNVLLIGGDGAGYKYDKTYYKKLASFIKKTHEKTSKKWLITTSRRTPNDMEDFLLHEVKECCEYFVAYNQKPQKVMLSFLGCGSEIFVTEESSSMISEAIGSKKPVYTIKYKNSTDNNYKKILEKFCDEGKISRIDLDDEFQKSTFNIPDISYKEILAQKLKNGLYL